MSKPITAIAAALCLFATASAWAGVFSPRPASGGTDDFRFMPKVQSTLEPKAVDANGIMTPDEVQTATYYQDAVTVGALFSPEGEEWFYTLELDGTLLNPGNPYYKDMDYRTFHLKVYDGALNFVGQVKGEAVLPEGAVRCRTIGVAAQLTRSFFNTNRNDVEVMFALAFNPGPDDKGNPRYGAKQTTQAYSLTEELPAEGSKMLFHVPGYYVSAINRGNNISENYVLTFFDDTSWDGEDINHADVSLYSKAGWGTSAQLLTKMTVDLRLTMCDGFNESKPCMTKAYNNELYFTTAHYEKEFLKDPTADDPTMADGNNYIVTLYKLIGNKLEQLSETKIKCEKPEGEDFVYRSYALGNFSDNGDISFDFTDGDEPAFIITVVDSGKTEETSAYYAIYDVSGKEIKRFGENSGGYVYFPAIGDFPEQYGFEMTSKDGEHGTVLFNFPSLEEVGLISTLFEYEGDAWNLISVPGRVMLGGKVYYAAAALPYASDGTGAAHYVAWFNADGSLDHMDALHLGKDAAKVLSYIHESVLNPYLFNTDKKMEYFCWVYRAKPAPETGTSLELVVCDDTGKVLACRKLPDTRAYENAFVSNSKTDPYIVISYRNIVEGPEGDLLRNEFIRLPLNGFEGEGTVESPYLIKTYGDLDQVRNNLSSHFRLAASIDCSGFVFRPIEGDFTGSFDGAGLEIRNLTIDFTNSGDAFFESFGVPGVLEPGMPVATLKNVTFTNPVIRHNAATIGVKTLAFVAAKAQNATFENVYVVNPEFEDNTMSYKYGTIVSSARDTRFLGCGVSDADVSLPLAAHLGGLVGEAQGGSIIACSFDGKLVGRSNVGGIVGRLDASPAQLADLHVDATLEGSTVVGGVVGQGNRSFIRRAIVEGSIKADDTAAGIVAYLPPVEDAEGVKIIDKCVVALDKIEVPAGAKCVHRLVGFSIIDLGEHQVWVPDPNDNEKGEYVLMPPTHEEGIGENYVVSDLAAFDTDPAVVTEGTDKKNALSEDGFFENLGYKFAKFQSMASTDEPWVREGADMPELFFEDVISADLYFAESELSGKIGEKMNVDVYFDGVDSADFIFEFSDPTIAELANFLPGATEHQGVMEFNLLKKGTTTFTLSAGAKKAAVTITVSEATGVENVVVSALAYDGTTVRGEGCTIVVFDAQGRQVAAGRDTVSVATLASGVYFVRAIDAAANPQMLKIAVK